MPRFFEDAANCFLEMVYVDMFCANVGLSTTYGISIFVWFLALCRVVVFLMRGHSVRSHAAITSGSRWRGTRWGFWRVNPRSRNQVQRYRGLRRMPNSCWIKWARRRLVHNSMSNPCSVGFSLNQRRTIFSWVAESLGGRPATGPARSPSAPDRRKQENQRRTDRGSTSRNSATSSVEYPSTR